MAAHFIHEEKADVRIQGIGLQYASQDMFRLINRAGLYLSSHDPSSPVSL